MDILKQSDLEQLIEVSGKWCVSIYMPTHRVGREQQQDPTRLGNLIARAQEKLLEAGLRKPEVQELLHPAESLLEDQEEFWQHQSDGLAIFSSEDFSEVLRLPHSFEELVVVANSFHLKPLLPLLSKDGKFYILAISGEEIRLFLGTKDTVEQVELRDVPTSMKEALWMDDPEKFTGFHTGTGTPAQGERQAVFHGHGGEPADDKTNILRYFQYVDEGLNNLLEDKSIPMILAGVEYLQPIYQEANTYQSLLEVGLHGTPEERSEDELHDAAWKLVESIFEADQKRDQERFEQFYGQENGLAIDDLNEAVKAAYSGQVETLFIPLGVQKWGRYDVGQNQVILEDSSNPENEDLLDYVAVQTILNSGQVYAVELEELPGKGDLADILRYAG